MTPPFIKGVIGSTVTFVCEATGELSSTVMWSVDENDPYIMVEGNNLTISNIDKKHAKSYTCIATDKINTVTQNGVLQVNCEYEYYCYDILNCNSFFLT